MGRIHTDVSDDLHKRLKARFNSDDLTMQQWVLSALLLKLGSEGEGSKHLMPDPLAELPKKEKLAVRRYIKALKTYPEEFREALMEACQTIYRLHSRTPRRTSSRP